LTPHSIALKLEGMESRNRLYYGAILLILVVIGCTNSDSNSGAPTVATYPRFIDVNSSGSPDSGDCIVIPFTKEVTVNGALPTDIFLPVDGDSFGDGSILLQGPGTNEVTIQLGTTPVFRVGGKFKKGNTEAADPSGIDIAKNLPPDAIVDAGTGEPVRPHEPIDVIAGFRDSGQVIPTGRFVTELVLADIDKDNDLDLLMANNGSWIMKNDGSGNFTNTNQDLGGNLRSFAVGDVNGDTHLDIVAGYSQPTPIKVWFNDGNGVFSDSGQQIVVIRHTYSIALGDLDADGDLDFVAGDPSDANEGIWVNNGSGFFSFFATFPKISGQLTKSVAIADLDGDTYLDVVIGRHGGYSNVYWNDGNANFTKSTQNFNWTLRGGGGGGGGNALTLADIDGDLDLDLILVDNNYPNPSMGGHIVQIYRNNGNRFFSRIQLIAHGPVEGLATGDIDQDGDIDFVDAANNYEASIFYNRGDGFFKFTNQSMVPEAREVGLGDLDGDTDLDLVVGGAPTKVFFNSLK